MAISKVIAVINGTAHTLTYDSASGQYKATITAPGATSFNLDGGYYNVRIEATNDAGTTGTADGLILDGLQLVVKERVAPVITILSPSSGAYVTNSKQPVVFTVVDESGGSGVDLSSVLVELDGNAVDSGAITNTAITNGYSFTYTPASALSEGSHTIVISASDNDGNAATEKSTTFTVDTVPPTLNLSSPSEGEILSTNSVAVRGTTNDSTSSPVAVAVYLNGALFASVSPDSNGSFSSTVTGLIEGENEIKVVVTDSAGKSTTISRTVTVNTAVPTITAASIAPNPVDAGATMIISVTVTEG